MNFKLHKKAIHSMTAVLLLVLLTVIGLNRDTMVQAEYAGKLPDTAAVTDQDGKARSVGVGGQGTLNLKGSPITTGSVPVIDAWNIHGTAVVEHQSYVRMQGSDGSGPYSVYCMDYGKSANTGTVMTGRDMGNLSVEQRKQLGACLSFGCSDQTSSPDAAQKAKYAATQAMVWNIMSGLFPSESGDKAAEQYLSYVEDARTALQFYRALKHNMLTYELIPGFTTAGMEDAPAYELKWNTLKSRYETVASDQNAVTGKSTFTFADGVGVEVTDSEVIIYSDRSIDSPALISGKRSDLQLKDCVMYWNDRTDTQRFGVSDIHTTVDMSPFYFKVHTEKAKIDIEKVDSETGKSSPLGAAKAFEGTVYDLFGPDYKVGDTKESPSFIRPLRLDKEGKANADNLPVQKYILKEQRAPEGYLLDEKPYEINFPLKDGDNPVHAKVRSEEDVIRGDIEIMKFGQDKDQDETEIKRPLSGIEFTLTSLTTGEKFTITTDKSGYASTKKPDSERGGLPFDTYRIEETKGKEGYKTIDPFEVAVKEEGQMLRYIIEDKIVRAALRIQKADLETGRIIPVKGTEFQILDEKDQPVVMYTYYPKKEAHKTYATDDTGTLTLPGRLDYGKYTLVEVKAPEGYLKADPIPFEIRKTADYDTPLTITCKDTSVKGKIQIRKIDAYTEKPLSGIQFEVRAAKEIKTPDGTVRAAKDELMETLTTDDEGKAVSGELYLGTYLVQEVKQLPGYIIPGEPEKVTLSYKDQETPLITYKLKVENKPMEVKIHKIDKDTGQNLEGVEFSVWKKDENANAAEKKQYTTGKDGLIRLRYLEPGTYCYQETQALSGYLGDDTVHEFRIDNKGLVNQNEDISITVVNEKIIPPVPGKEQTKKPSGAPKTGDNSGLIVLTLFLFLSCLLLLQCAKISHRDD